MKVHPFVFACRHTSMLATPGTGHAQFIVNREAKSSKEKDMRIMYSLQIVVLTLIYCLTIGTVAADNLRTPANTIDPKLQSNKLPVGAGSQLQAITAAPITGMKQQIIRELSKSEAPQLNWPTLPRTWLERSITDIQSSNTNLGLKVPVLNAGGKLSIEFRYGLKTSLIMISSRRTNGARPSTDFNDPIRSLNPAEEAEIIFMDERTHTTYPNVREEFPMVGLCIFEASLNIEKGQSLSLDFLGFDHSQTNSRLETFTQSAFSKFFQVSSNVSIDSYLNNLCGQVFRRDVEPFIISDFSKLVIERVIKDNPDSQCSPTDPQTFEIASGDQSCLDWHHQNFTRGIQKITVPRCELQKNGAHKCVLKGRAETACGMYMNTKSQSYSPVYDRHRFNIHATKGHFEYACDKTQKLSCQMYDDPMLLLGVPFFEGRAKCVPDKN